MEETEDFLSLDTDRPKKKKVKKVHLREESHGSTTFRVMSKKDSTKMNHISESVLNFRKVKTFGRLSRAKRESAQELARRKAKYQASGKAVFCK